ISTPMLDQEADLLTTMLRTLGVRAGLADGRPLAVRLTLWHELAHVVPQMAYLARHDSSLAEDTFAAGVSTPLYPDLRRSTARRIEEERFAEGLALLLLAEHIAREYRLTRTQRELMPAALRDMTIDAWLRPDRTGAPT